VNYYPFHIGDYLSATRHLSWEEDAAYRRLLDTYYTNEKPLPVELRAVCRLVLAQTDAQREAVEVVLNEFFELTPDGWINHRADSEIESMRDKQIAQDEKNSHEANRLKRHRERRAEMFEMLRVVGIVPAYDVSIKELQRLVDENCNAPETRTQPLHETDSQRLSLPTPTPTPILKEEEQKTVAPSPLPEPSPKEKRFDAQAYIESLGVQAGIASDWLALRKSKKSTVTATAIDRLSAAARKAGVSLEAALATCCARGWAGFEADWLLNDKQRQQGPQGSPTSFNNRIASGAATIMRGLEQ
jgi:uncharacterized protein YdaU (DUF1376 family)